MTTWYNYICDGLILFGTYMACAPKQVQKK